MSGALLLAADIRRISNDEGFGLIVGHLLRRVNFLDAGQIKDFFLLNGFHGRRADLKPVEPQGIAADNVSVPAASPSAAGSPEVELDGRDKGHRGDDARSEQFFMLPRNRHARVGQPPIARSHRSQGIPCPGAGLVTQGGDRANQRALTLEFGEVARDHRGVEASENRLLRLAIEQEAEGRLETAFRRMLAGCQPLAHLSRHRHAVTGFTASFTDDHLEIQRVALGNAPDFRLAGFSSDEQRAASHVGGQDTRWPLHSGPRFNVVCLLATCASVAWTGEGGSKPCHEI